MAEPGSSGAVLALIRSREATTRNELADHLGIGRSTVVQRLAVLADANLVVAAGDAQSSGGRPAGMFAFNESAGVVLVGDLGQTGCHLAVCDLGARPLAEHTAPLSEGDFILIDIWGRLPQAGAVYYDITWTGVIGREPSAREQQVFETVRKARDAAIAAVEQAFAAKRPIRGFEADDAARAVIREAGFGAQFTHRTGHNIAEEIHGPGAHLDNLETHDERRLLDNTCFSVEPGIYLPEFGVRSEIDMMTRPGRAEVTGRIQTELVRI